MACKLLVVVALAALTCHAHICFTFPMQRGDAPPLLPGDPVCYNRVPNCGKLPKGAPKSSFRVGALETMQFQQNLNHWYEQKPGHFDFAVSYDGDKTWLPIGGIIDDFPANNMNTQTFFSVPVVFTQASKNATVRARYVSYNPDEVYPAENTDAIFYSCADVEIVAQSVKIRDPQPEQVKRAVAPVQPKKQAAKKPSADAPMFHCVTPPQWSAVGKEYIQGRDGAALDHEIHYDSIGAWVKWHRNDTAYGGLYDVTDIWNLTSADGYTPQYLVGLYGPNTCSMYGGDQFFPWQYGKGMVFRFNETHPDGTIVTLGSDSADFTWRAWVPTGSATCLPMTIHHGLSTIEFYSTPVTGFAPGTFTVPAYCNPVANRMPDGGCKAMEQPHA